MKILSVYFKNINSLKGEHRLAFDQAPLASAGVFAITGPNGSGKSTILDAITLALYGQTFRFDRPADHVMTKHTGDCFAEIVFALGTAQYRSAWRATRERGDAYAKVLQPEMRLFRVDGEAQLLADQPQLVRNKIMDLTGLDFRRFTRSIMLAQGDFAAFLNALDTERLDVLEKIISADIYDDFKRDIKNQAAQAQTQIQELQAEMQSLGLFDPLKLEACEQDRQDFQEQLKDFKAEKQALQQQHNWLQNIEALQQGIGGIKQRYAAIEQQFAQKQAYLQKIAASQQMLAFQDAIREIDTKTAEINREQEFIANLHQEHTQLQEKLLAFGADSLLIGQEDSKSVLDHQQQAANLKNQIAQIEVDRDTEAALLESLQRQVAEKQGVLQTVQTWLASNRSEQKLVDDFPDLGKLKKLRSDILVLQDKQKTFIKWQKTTYTTLQRNQGDLGRVAKKILALRRDAQAYEKELRALSQGHTQEEITELRIDQQERLKQIRQLLDLASVNERLSKAHAKLLSRLHGRDMDAPSLRVEFDALNDKFLREQNIKNVLEQSINQEVLLKRLAADRVYLLEDKPCPLCGALKHPYAQQPPVVGDSRRALADQNKKLQNLQVVLEKLGQQMQAAEKMQQEAQKQEQQLLQVRSQWLSISSRLNQAGEIRIDSFRMMKRLYKTENSELSDIVSMEKKCLRLRDKCNKLQLQIERLEAEAQQMRGSSAQLDADWKNPPQDLQNAEQAYAACRQEHDAVTDTVLKQLAAIGEKMPSPGKEDAMFDRLNARRQDFRTYQLRSDGLMQEIQELEKKMTVCKIKLADFDRSLQRCKENLQATDASALHFLLLEKQRLLTGKQQTLVQKQSELAELTHTLQALLATTGFVTLDALREILALINSQEQLQRDSLDLQRQLQENDALLVKEQAQLQAEQALALTLLSAEELKVQLRGIAGKIDIVQGEIQHTEAQLQEQYKLRDIQVELNARLEHYRKLYAECQSELQQSGEAGFRRRVQKRMADRLLTLANQYLQKISGRYLLHQRDSEQGLALDIEDTYQQNIRRLPKTLSGGECFVVSLALSLGLADIANGGNSVDSLFLDEGFGTLDDNTLVVVVETLKSLHQHGKTVGVISHVKGVHDRIETKIEMTKRLDGISELAIAS